MTFFSIELYFIVAQYFRASTRCTRIICEDPKKRKIMKLPGLSMLAFH